MPGKSVLPATPVKIVANAIPSKELFINMLVKDITLIDAIGDLVDNSVDAANSHADANGKLHKFHIHIQVTTSSFEISDNCGGIELDIAQKSAFKLGKPIGYKAGKHTIGQFGIGMKRAFFKIGQSIKVDSTALNSSFTIDIDVPKWKAKPDEKDWDFAFTTTSKTKHPLSQTSTKIKITNLNTDSSKQFGLDQFINDLRNEIALEHAFSINHGLKITINDKEPLKAPSMTLIYDKNIKPVYWDHKFPNGLTVEILAGASEDQGEDGGWYIFCNDRLVLGPDTTAATGWSGGRGKGGRELPKYHDQFYRFRGYVFFNSNDSSKLPWNTTKTGMNEDSPDYSFVRSHMITLGKQVKELLDDLKKERERNNPQRALNDAVNNAKVVSLASVLKDKRKLPSTYTYPKKLMTVVPKSEIRISFSRSTGIVNRTMRYFNLTDPSEAGAAAFDYFTDKEL